MKDTITEKNKIINYIITALAVISLITGIALMVYDYQLEQKAININAIITSLDYENGVNKATIKYKIDRESYRQEIKLNSNKYSVNDELPIKYDINNPGKLINNNHLIISIAAISLSLLLFIISLKGTIKNIKRSKNIKNLVQKGIYVQAIISEIYIDNKEKKKNGNYPYKLRAKFNNPLDNQIYVFDSEPTYIDLNSVIKKYNNQMILVYLDKNNTSNYYVDLDSLFPHVNLVDVGSIMGEKKKETKPTEGEMVDKNENKTDSEKLPEKKEDKQ
jgi:hypothetical protein